MQIEVRFRGFEASTALREHTVWRTRSRMRRFGAEVASVVVWIEDINGPRGGVDKRCQVVLRGPALAAISAEDRSASAYAAVDCATERAARAAGRDLARVRARRRDERGIGRAS